MPATIEHGKGEGSGSETGSSAVVVASTVQYFITAMDSLKLDMTATDEVYPLLSDIMQSLHKVSQRLFLLIIVNFTKVETPDLPVNLLG